MRNDRHFSEAIQQLDEPAIARPLSSPATTSPCDMKGKLAMIPRILSVSIFVLVLFGAGCSRHQDEPAKEIVKKGQPNNEAKVVAKDGGPIKKNADDMAGKRTQKLDDVIAMRNKKIGPVSPPLSEPTKEPTGNASNDDKAIYQRGYDEGFSLGKLYGGRLAAMDAVTRKEFAQTYQQELQGHEATLRQITQAYGTDHPQVMAKMGFCNGLRTALAQAK